RPPSSAAIEVFNISASIAQRAFRRFGRRGRLLHMAGHAAGTVAGPVPAGLEVYRAAAGLSERLAVVGPDPPDRVLSLLRGSRAKNGGAGCLGPRLSTSRWASRSCTCS